MPEQHAIGREHVDEFRPGFHDRLAQNWPEPREQLHAGGWQSTRDLVRELGMQGGYAVLEVCCGEGGSAVWMARAVGVRISGLDIVYPAIAAAQHRAQSEGVEAVCAFVHGNLFHLPLQDASFDVVYGQDPDGFAHKQRIVAFQECLRVLRPGGRFGMHHWIPGVDAPRAFVDRLDQVNVEMGFPSHGDVCADAYMAAMRDAAFRDIRMLDWSARYRQHMQGIRARMQAHGQEVDRWTALWLELSARHPFGVALLGRKAL